MSDNEIPGIWIDMASGLFEERKFRPTSFEAMVAKDPDARDYSAVKAPVYIPAVTIDKLIQDGSWKAGKLNGVECNPDVSEWPERWRFLKTE